MREHIWSDQAAKRLPPSLGFPKLIGGHYFRTERNITAEYL